MSHTAETLLLAMIALFFFILGVFLVKYSEQLKKIINTLNAILESQIILLRRNGVGSDEIDKVRGIV